MLMVWMYSARKIPKSGTRKQVLRDLVVEIWPNSPICTSYSNMNDPKSM